jgi:hypothetical protein
MEYKKTEYLGHISIPRVNNNSFVTEIISAGERR